MVLCYRLTGKEAEMTDTNVTGMIIALLFVAAVAIIIIDSLKGE